MSHTIDEAARKYWDTRRRGVAQALDESYQLRRAAIMDIDRLRDELQREKVLVMMRGVVM